MEVEELEIVFFLCLHFPWEVFLFFQHICYSFGIKSVFLYNLTYMLKSACFVNLWEKQLKPPSIANVHLSFSFYSQIFLIHVFCCHFISCRDA